MHQIAADENPATTELVDEEEAAEFAEEGEEVGDALVLEGVDRGDACQRLADITERHCSSLKIYQSGRRCQAKNIE